MWNRLSVNFPQDNFFSMITIVFGNCTNQFCLLYNTSAKLLSSDSNCKRCRKLCEHLSTIKLFFYFYNKDLQFVSCVFVANCPHPMIDNGVGFNYEYIAVETDNPKRYRVGTVMNLACDQSFCTEFNHMSRIRELELPRRNNM